ncbi:MAG: hypothetical protein M3488_02005 [Actinomycetota bacterium]|nr:hypothetical protein [Actinomycetota bacterium]
MSDAEFEQYLRSSHAEAARSFDRTLLTLAGGALGLSVTFFVGQDPRPSSGHGWLLAGWLTLVVCLVALAVSHWTSEQAFWLLLNERDSEANRWRSWVGRLNSGALVAVTVGLACLAVFAWLNV